MIHSNENGSSESPVGHRGRPRFSDEWTPRHPPARTRPRSSQRPILTEQALVRDPQRHLDPGPPHLLPRHAQEVARRQLVAEDGGPDAARAHLSDDGRAALGLERESRPADELSEYARVYRVSRVMRPYMEALS